ncbi:MAG: hypothetical protein WBV73_12505 [Phormidium sp.]
MRFPRKLLKKMTFVCLALVTALLLVVIQSISTGQPVRTPNGEILPAQPVSTPNGEILPAQPVSTPNGEILPAQPVRTPNGEILPAQPVSTPNGETLPAQPVRTPNRKILPAQPVWLLPVTTNPSLSRPIVANPDVATIPFGESRKISVLTNDIGKNLTLISVEKGRSRNGCPINTNSDGTITYGKCQPNFFSDSFIYKIKDSYGKTASGTVFVEIIPLGTKP